ncbi:MAG TPA: GIY-YIG nuclease family protein [Chryseolinea sp.]|nr:GIY-YIG nuclease family protein [Chryseolinea sp.]
MKATHKVAFSVMHYYVYILWSASLSKTYTGFTTDLSARALAHNVGVKGWTIRGRPWMLIHREAFTNKIEALKREKYFKTGAGRDYIKQCILPKI